MVLPQILYPKKQSFRLLILYLSIFLLAMLVSGLTKRGKYEEKGM